MSYKLLEICRSCVQFTFRPEVVYSFYLCKPCSNFATSRLGISCQPPLQLVLKRLPSTQPLLLEVSLYGHFANSTSRQELRGHMLQAPNFAAFRPRDVRVSVPSGTGKDRTSLSHVAWSCDGRRLSSAGYEKAVRLWQPEKSVGRQCPKWRDTTDTTLLCEYNSSILETRPRFLALTPRP